MKNKIKLFKKKGFTDYLDCIIAGTAIALNKFCYENEQI